MKEAYIECGKVTGVHGVVGAMRAEPWTDSWQVFSHLRHVYLREPDGMKAFRVLSAVLHKGGILLKLEGISTPEEAAALKNRVLFARREEIPLPKGRSFIVDLIGLPVRDADSGHLYGTVSDVLNTGASDLYEVQMENGKKALIPAVPEFIIKVDEEKEILVRPIEGMFE